MSLIDVYKSMADESRLRLVHALGQGSFNVQELTSVVDLTQPTVSHHLKVLQNAGLVRSHKEGTWVYYALSPLEDYSEPATIGRNFLEILSHLDPSSDFRKLCNKDSQAVKLILQSRHERTKDFFESVAHEWKDLRSNEHMNSYLELIQDKIPAEETLLELGCGSGALMELLLPRAGKTFGVDYSQAMLDATRKNLKERAALVDLRLGYLEHLPFGDRTIDLAVAHMVFHHLPEPRAALSDVFRVLRPGGTLLIVDLLRHEDESMRESQADLWLGFDPNIFKNWALESGFIESTAELLDGNDAFLLTAKKEDS